VSKSKSDSSSATGLSIVTSHFLIPVNVTSTMTSVLDPGDGKRAVVEEKKGAATSGQAPPRKKCYGSFAWFCLCSHAMIASLLRRC
jgi:hypothetical protein